MNESEYPEAIPEVPGDAGVPEAPNLDVRNDEVADPGEGEPTDTAEPVGPTDGGTEP